jgi:hypothetical protein
MRRVLVFALFSFVFFQSCGIFGALTSQTSIEPGKSFVLGEGKHGSYTAVIQNNTNIPVEVFIQKYQSEVSTSLGVLNKGDKQEYRVAKDNRVSFKNLGKRVAVINIKLNGDTNLSMGYKENN